MAEVLGSGFNQPLHSRGDIVRSSTKWFALVLGGALLTSGLAATAQVAPPRNAKRNTAPAPTPAPIAPIAQPANLGPRPLTTLPPIEPARPPAVSWDGKLLTIDAENAMLSDVLLAIRSRTGASIEMPGSASGERVAIHVGPAPIREVLSSLLYGTNFNYVIQSSEDDESGLGKVMLISRDGEGSDDATALDLKADKNIRMMPGYAAPGKRDFEVAHIRAMQEAAENQAADSGSQDSAPVATNDAGTNETPSTDSQPLASNSNSDSSSAQPDTGLTAAEQPLSRSTGIASSGETSSAADGSPSMANMEQSLQKMYEQRRQIQAQQNKNAPQTPPAP